MEPGSASRTSFDGRTQVTAVVRDPTRLTVPLHPRLQVVTADVMDPVALAPAVDGVDAVLTALGPRGSGPTSISEDSTRSILEAMEKCGVRRLVTVSGSIVDDTGNGLFMHRLIKPLARRTFLRNVCADMRRAEELVHASTLDWTIFRPPRLTDKPSVWSLPHRTRSQPARGVTISPAPTSRPRCSPASTTPWSGASTFSSLTDFRVRGSALCLAPLREGGPKLLEFDALSLVLELESSLLATQSRYRSSISLTVILAAAAVLGRCWRVG